MTVAIQAPAAAPTPTPTPTATPGPIQLRAQKKKDTGNKHGASPVEGGNFDQHRRLPQWRASSLQRRMMGSMMIPPATPGQAQYLDRVCEAGTQNLL